MKIQRMLLAALLFMGLSAEAQSDNSPSKWGAYGGMQVSSSAPFAQPVLWVGGHGAVVYDSHWAIGAFGSGAVNNVSVSGLEFNQNADLSLNMGFGGLFLEYIRPRKKPYIPSVRIPFGIGGISLEDIAENKVAKSDLYSFSPRLNWEFHLNDYFCIGFFSGYQMLWAKDNVTFNQNDLSSWEYGLSFKIGRF